MSGAWSIQLGVGKRTRVDTTKDAEHRPLPQTPHYRSVHAEYIMKVCDYHLPLSVKQQSVMIQHPILFITERSMF